MKKAIAGAVVFLVAGLAATMILRGGQDTGKSPLNPGVTEVRCSKIGREVIINGELGLPVGQTVTISGTKVECIFHSVFHVSNINDRPLTKSIPLCVEGIAHWPNGTTATITGCERGVLYFGSRDFNRQSPAPEGPGQYLLMTFKVSGIKAPKGLAVEKD